jgi:hypothetical protein
MPNTDKEHKEKNESKVIVNGQEKTVTQKELSYSDVVNLAYNNASPTGENVEISVSYRRGEDKKATGTLSAGETVKVKDGMIFDVTATDKS